MMGTHHHGNDDAAGQHADAVNRTLKERQKTERGFEPGKQMVAQQRQHHKNSPQAEDHARHGGQQFNDRDERLAHPQRGQFGQKHGSRDADGHCDEQRDSR